MKDTGFKQAKGVIYYDVDNSDGTIPTAVTRTLNFVDKIVYPTTSTSLENSKPWTNAESVVSGKATGTVAIDYTMFSDNSITVDFTLTYSMSGVNVLVPTNEALFRVCTSPFSPDGTSAAKSVCAQTKWINESGNAAIHAGHYSGT